MAFKCPLCVFLAATLTLILGHIRLVHSSDPGFNVTCGIDGCSRKFQTFRSLYQHIYRKHKESGIIQSRTEYNIEQSDLPMTYDEPTNDSTGILDNTEGQLHKQLSCAVLIYYVPCKCIMKGGMDTCWCTPFMLYFSHSIFPLQCGIPHKCFLFSLMCSYMYTTAST